ncbi:mannitol dehydrogenase, putative [Phytophthora infestans T30-4]|uniref:Mannitol dehydrogenase, putative n=1 Tax=Phytophthora infestans (strain T30-4) TaxID=403677 RepID=D0NUP1_PHYIT|nr:mannitol dehydrogenase, putative [Phytophthora infestans T30-4]EEY65387.1 mannitol dehydrogenase, putative [Phytophthora infestans T30-4]|eukprot:XP_002897250.1 mannitol dehydrogenase, putative [Phytophthora infestans T30-4]
MSSAPRTVNAFAAFEPSGRIVPFQYESRLLGPDDVEIKISHCGICGSDIHHLDSGWKPTMYPCVFGHEIIGDVSVVGVSVKHLAVGDRVGVGAQVWACLNKDPKRPCEECGDGENAFCNRSVITYDANYEDGSMANFAFKIPGNIPSTAAAPLLCAGVTVFTPLKRNVKPGDRVGVIVIGGLGHLAIQFIRALGATPVAFSRSADKEKEVRALGAEEFYNLSDPKDQKKAENSVNVLLLTADATNMPYNTFLTLVKKRGIFVMVGVPNDEVKFKPMFVVAKGIKWVGSLIGGIQAIQDMLALASEKNVRAIVQQMPMSKVNEGIAMMREGRVRYRVVLEN